MTNSRIAMSLLWIGLQIIHTSSTMLCNTTDMHVLRPISIVRSARPSLGEGTGGAERPSDHIQDRNSKEEMHDQVTGEAKRNEVEQSEEEIEDDNTRATVEITRPRDESTDPKDDNISKEDTSGDEETLEEDDGYDGEEPNGTTLHSESTHRLGGVSTDTSDYDYHPCKLSGPRQSLDEPAMTMEGQGQEQVHDSTKDGKAHEDCNQTIEMNMEQVFGVEEDESQSSPRSNIVQLS